MNWKEPGKRNLFFKLKPKFRFHQNVQTTPEKTHKLRTLTEADMQHLPEIEITDLKD